MAEENKARYFGEPFKEKKSKERKFNDIIVPENTDGSYIIKRKENEFSEEYNGKIKHSFANGFDPSNEAEMIQTYRNVSDHPDVSFAIEEIVNEMFVTDGETKPISLNLDSLEEIDDSRKELISEEFEKILSLLNFNRDAFEIFRRFYIDSRIYYYKLVDPKNPSKGIQELKYIDPISIRKIKEIKVKETAEAGQRMNQVVDSNSYYLYTPKSNAYGNKSGGLGNQNNGFGSIDSSSLSNLNDNAESYIIKSYAISEATSGMFDHSRNCIKGHLHKAIKPLNDITNLETHMIIYRVARAPERRVFYIDTGALPPKKAQQYINLVQDSYRREINYDSSTGEINADNKTISMHEDFWLPRSSDGKGTQVDTLSGASNLGELSDVEYMNKKFRNSLNIPVSRFDSENPVTMVLGGSSENNKDEIKFQKFISRLRSRFSSFLKDLLGTQLLLKSTVTSEEWTKIENIIVLEYVRDSYLEDLRKYAIFQQKVEIVKDADELVGRYISKEFVWKELLKFTDEEIEEMKEQIKKENEENPPEDGF